MPDWKNEISNRVAGLQLEPTREVAIIEELAQHLEDHYGELLAGGATEAERGTLAELNESELLIRELRPAERVEPEPSVFGNNQGTKIVADLWQDLRYGARILNPGHTPCGSAPSAAKPISSANPT